MHFWEKKGKTWKKKSRMKGGGESQWDIEKCCFLPKRNEAVPAGHGLIGLLKCLWHRECKYAALYMKRHSRMGNRQAGTRFMTLIFVMPSIFRLRAAMSREPTQVISAITASPPRKGAMKDALREMSP